MGTNQLILNAYTNNVYIYLDLFILNIKKSLVPIIYISLYGDYYIIYLDSQSPGIDKFYFKCIRYTQYRVYILYMLML